MPDFSIGVDLGGTNLRIAAITSDGEMLEKITLGVKVISGRDQVIDEMCNAIQRLSAKYQHAGNLLGAGIGVPGVIDLANGTMRKAANLPGWEDYPVRAEIERRLGARVIVENDANVAALGEQWLGAARGVPDVAVVTLGTGIGGAIVLNGKIWHGMNGMAGEFGHITVEPDGPPCGCGSHGCAEQYASASSIIRMAHELIASGESSELAKAASDPEFGARSVYNLAMQGDEHARRIFVVFGRYLGILLAALINILNLEMFVIGGGVLSAWEAFAPTMFAEIRERSLIYAATGPTDPMSQEAIMWGRLNSPVRDQLSSAAERQTIITRAVLGSDAGLFGAARLAVSSG